MIVEMVMVGRRGDGGCGGASEWQKVAEYYLLIVICFLPIVL